MKQHKCRIVVVKTVRRTPKSCPFDDMKISLRELSRRTGIDVSYLSKVRRGVIPVTEEMYERLLDAFGEALA